MFTMKIVIVISGSSCLESSALLDAPIFIFYSVHSHPARVTRLSILFVFFHRISCAVAAVKVDSDVDLSS